MIVNNYFNFCCSIKTAIGAQRIMGVLCRDKGFLQLCPLLHVCPFDRRIPARTGMPSGAVFCFRRFFLFCFLEYRFSTLRRYAFHFYFLRCGGIPGSYLVSL
ncbi:unnamed protein product [Meloidogyne enterolobii]|uniref:Uncharacterized protein n=1 Tax=Meloidogyne enterolobii TaxID=390850 RepID=A0ACB1AU76_MELEN